MCLGVLRSLGKPDILPSMLSKRDSCSISFAPHVFGEAYKHHNGHRYVRTVDEARPTAEFCMANIGASDEAKDYQSCGEKLRLRKDGLFCPVHGEMH